ncbi:MAG: hypothetical protein ACYDEN_09000 [Acidimicrobiales bacterium]
MFLGGELELFWSDGLTALLRWWRQRRADAANAARLVDETSAWLAAQPPPLHPGRA